MKKHDLAREMGMNLPHERALLKSLLRDLENQGKIVRSRGNRWTVPDVQRRITGTLRVHPNRFGFVSPDAQWQPTEDIFVPEDGLFTALDGDRVLVEIGGTGRKRFHFSSPTGRILRVIQRNRTQIVGRLCKSQWYWYVVPDSPRLIHNVRVWTPEQTVARQGHKVVVRLHEWKHPNEPLEGEIIEDLGEADESGVDLLSVIRDHQIVSDFPPEVEAEAERLVNSHDIDSEPHRVDLRSLVVFTIDPVEAKDYDDAISLEITDRNYFKLRVHIADVSHYVRPNTAIDREAFLRGNSVYLVDRAIPMLPPQLSSHLCSLHPGQDRLTRTVEMVFDAEGRLQASRTFPSLICSSARLNYDQVQRFFDGHGVDPDIPDTVLESLRQMRTLASLLLKRRMTCGSLDLWMPEIQCILDENGIPLELFPRGANEAYQVIEEFMLAANRVVAQMLANHETPSIFRIHPPPEKRQWERMEQELDALGIRLRKRSRDAINEIARHSAFSPSDHVIHLAILRNLKRAVYSPVLSEHFGLAFDAYTHFTSPIRRYPDLVVHRLLKALERGERPPISQDDAVRISEHCSWTERNADEAETESLEIKRLQYFARLLRSGEIGPFDGVIVNLVPKGLIVELTDSLLRGLIPFHSLGGDYYVLDEGGVMARGRRTRRIWRIGTPVRVTITRIDQARRQADFALADATRAISSLPLNKQKLRPLTQRIK